MRFGDLSCVLVLPRSHVAPFWKLRKYVVWGKSWYGVLRYGDWASPAVCLHHLPLSQEEKRCVEFPLRSAVPRVVRAPPNSTERTVVYGTWLIVYGWNTVWGGSSHGFLIWFNVLFKSAYTWQTSHYILVWNPQFYQKWTRAESFLKVQMPWKKNTCFRLVINMQNLAGFFFSNMFCSWFPARQIDDLLDLQTVESVKVFIENKPVRVRKTDRAWHELSHRSEARVCCCAAAGWII